jgi:hypothetical protein
MLLIAIAPYASSPSPQAPHCRHPVHFIPITLYTLLPSCQSIGHDNHNQILKDIETFALEEYIKEIAGAVPEGIV